MAKTHWFYCKRCGEAKDFASKEEFLKFRDEHRPRLNPRRVSEGRGYRCQLEEVKYVSKKGKERWVLKRKSLIDKEAGL